jgi:hypothetical protein
VVMSNMEVPLEVRKLVPIPVVFILLLPTILCFDHREKVRKWGMVIFMLFAVSMVARTVQVTYRVYHNGLGYGAKAWVKTDLVKTVKTLRDDVPVFTNRPEAFYYYNGRPARQIPTFWMDPAPFFSEKTAREFFVSKGALAIIFNEKDFSAHPKWLQFVRSVPLQVVFRDGWGVIYAYKRPAGQK